MKGIHHFLLCRKKSDNSNSYKEPIVSYHMIKKGALVSATSHSSLVFMQMAKVPVIDRLGRVEMAIVLFDTGGIRTYISSEFVKKIKPRYEGSEHINYVAFGSNKTSTPTLRNIFSVHLKCVNQNGCKTVIATEVPTICAPLFCPKIPLSELQNFGEIDFRKCMITNESVKVDILIGMDAYWSVMKSGWKRVNDLVAQETVFEWILSGQSSMNDSESATSTAGFPTL